MIKIPNFPHTFYFLLLTYTETEILDVVHLAHIIIIKKKNTGKAGCLMEWRKGERYSGGTITI
jgi:hypothetical protein